MQPLVSHGVGVIFEDDLPVFDPQTEPVCVGRRRCLNLNQEGVLFLLQLRPPSLLLDLQFPERSARRCPT